MPVERRCGNCDVRAIAGASGVVTDRPTEPIYLDVALSTDFIFTENVPLTHNAFDFVINGSLWIEGLELPPRTMAILGEDG